MGLTRQLGPETLTSTNDRTFDGSNNWTSYGSDTFITTGGQLIMNRDAATEYNGAYIRISNMEGITADTLYSVSVDLRFTTSLDEDVGEWFVSFKPLLGSFETSLGFLKNNTFSTFTGVVRTPSVADGFDPDVSRLSIYNKGTSTQSLGMDNVSCKLAVTYTNIFYDFVLDGIRDLLTTEYPSGNVYIGPNKSLDAPFQVQIWGESAATDIHTAQSWQRSYQSTINLHFIEQNPNENFYKQMYADTERVAQVLFNNTNKTIVVEGDRIQWVEGIITNISFEEDEAQEGLHTASIEFSCVVNR